MIRTALSVNLNKVALLRNSRPLGIPSVLHAAELALEAGADGITIHPRPDQRHIRSDDVGALATLLRRWPAVELNIEGNPFHNLMDAARGARPAQCTFVPDDAGQATSDHGWDLARDGARLQPLIDEAHALGARVSLFMDPDPDAIAGARALGADRIELYTEPYARSYASGGATAQASLELYRRAAERALAAGLGVNAGHDLNLANLAPFIAEVPGVLEVSIGHALIADALEFGIGATVGKYRAQIERGHGLARSR
jgi:pyridoxine 5-phosphate synthase